jgi:NCAIR mutase (PurE)-related protein
MDSAALKQWLESWRRGELSLADLQRRLTAEPPAVTAVTEARLDLDRQRRCGFPEVIYGVGKSSEQLLEMVALQQQSGQSSLITRVADDIAEVLRARFPQAIHQPLARTIRIPVAGAKPLHGHVAVITAGTTDRPVAEEAAETARWMGCRVTVIVDVGVAGPQRLLNALPEFDAADAVVVVAGMEGALPSVVAGWVSCPVIAVPTSIGYGANFHGVAPLLSMLNSCAANVSVVNIDAGFKGGFLAGLIALRTTRPEAGDA